MSPFRNCLCCGPIPLKGYIRDYLSVSWPGGAVSGEAVKTRPISHPTKTMADNLEGEKEKIPDNKKEKNPEHLDRGKRRETINSLEGRAMCLSVAYQSNYNYQEKIEWVPKRKDATV